jgi:hypothetical protein
VALGGSGVKPKPPAAVATRGLTPEPPTKRSSTSDVSQSMANPMVVSLAACRSLVTVLAVIPSGPLQAPAADAVRSRAGRGGRWASVYLASVLALGAGGGGVAPAGMGMLTPLRGKLPFCTVTGDVSAIRAFPRNLLLGGLLAAALGLCRRRQRCLPLARGLCSGGHRDAQAAPGQAALL